MSTLATDSLAGLRFRLGGHLSEPGEAGYGLESDERRGNVPPAGLSGEAGS